MKKKGSAAGDDSDEDESDTKSLLGRSALGKSDKNNELIWLLVKYIFFII